MKAKTTILFVLISFGLFSQAKKDSIQFKHLSFGIRTGKDLGAELNDPVFAKLIVSVDPIKYFRIDFQYGRYKSIREVTSSAWGPTGSYQVRQKPEFKASSIAFGGFGMYNFDKTRIYLGYRYGISKYSQDEVYSLSTPSGSVPTIGTNTSKTNIHSFVLGGEQFIGKWFSVGAEFGLNKSEETFTSYQPGVLPMEAALGYTDGSLILRFYLL